MRAARLIGAALLALCLSSGLASARDDVVVGAVLEPPILDPTAGAAAAIDEVVYANVFQGLTRIARDGSVQPALATSWTISPDGLVYTFKLADGVTFSDGTPFTSADVKFSLDRAMAPDSTNPQKGLFEPIQSVETPDPSTVVITLKRPTGAFTWNLAWGDAVIVDPKTAATNKTTPVGTGPFVVAEWRKGDRIVLERREGATVPLAKVTFKFIGDPAAATAAMLAGDVDAFANFPAAEALPQLEADPRFKVVIGTTEGETILAINHAVKPFDDLRVRQALGHAIDRKALIDGAMFGNGIPIGSHFSPADPAYVDLTAKSAYDPELAKKLLAEAGVTGLKTTIALPPTPYARRGGEIIQAQLAAVGIQAELVPMEWAQWLEQVFTNKDYQLTIISHTEPMDIGIYGRDDYYFNYHNPQFQAVMAEVAATTDQAKRTELLRQAQTILADDAANVFLFELPKYGVWDARLVGMWENQPNLSTDMTEVHWAD